jgi:hypothetical protein
VHVGLTALVRPDGDMDAVERAGGNPKRVMPNLKTVARILVRWWAIPGDQFGPVFAELHLQDAALPALEISGHLSSDIRIRTNRHVSRSRTRRV